MQFNEEGRERVASYQLRQMKPAEKGYPIHDKKLLAMHYELIKFRVHLLVNVHLPNIPIMRRCAQR